MSDSDFQGLEIRKLHVYLKTHKGRVSIINDVNLKVNRGEVLGILGESGSGKTVTGSSFLRLNPSQMHVETEGMYFGGERFDTLSTKAFRKLRAKKFAMIFQNPTGSFNPAKRISWHFRHVLKDTSYGRAWQERSVSVLSRVGIGEPEAVLKLYPHQLSGGMLQRALIALILSNEPDLIVADEPTTNLDNIVERQVITLFNELRISSSATFVFITHDIGIASMLCDRIAVMYAGEIVEEGPAHQLFQHPKHPYTQGLFSTALSLEQENTNLSEIPGELPEPGNRLEGRCLFEPRCSFATADCRVEHPSLVTVKSGTEDQQVRCVLYR